MSIAGSRSTNATKANTILWSASVALFLLCFVATPRLAAQTSSAGVVLGTVTDASNAVVPGVDVQLTNLATGISVHQTTDAKGEYVFPQVAPGAYTLTFKADRFRTATLQNVAVEVNKSFTANMQMQVGEVSQTVEVRSTTQAELQTTDAQVGDVMSGDELQHMPTLTRSALELRNLQPATTPGNFDSGGTVAGARSDQNTITLDGLDISDSIVGGQGVREGQPASIENVQEFRTGVTNGNVDFGRSSGGDTTLVSRSGSNAFHGDVYWFHQNSAFNANTWDNNRAGTPRPELRDNRGGFSVGGPIIKNRTFFFGNYEIHRFPNVANFVDVVPTPTLASGILTFPDASGNNVAYNLAGTTGCGPANSSPCDPRGLGISPTVKALWALMPGGNGAGGDGLNTLGYSAQAATPTKDDDVSFRLDHNFTDKLHFFGRYFYDRNLLPALQYDIRNGKPNEVGQFPNRQDGAYGGLDYQISSNITNSFRFGWTRERADVIQLSALGSANELALNGSQSAVSGIDVALQPSTNFLSVPIDNSEQNSRTQLLNNTTKEIVDNLFWTKGTHTVTAGGDIHLLPFLLSHTDHNIATTSPVALLDSTGATGTIVIPSSDQPPTCSSSITTNCLLPGDVSRWNSLYVGALGIVNNVNLVGARGGNLQALPLLSNINSQTTEGAYNFYVQDSWRMRPSLTLTYGLGYGWQTPAHEVNGLQSLLANNDNGNSIITAQTYINAKAVASTEGNVFNPTLSFLPIRDSGRSSLYNTDWNDWAPRISAAWNPSYDNGLLGRLVGHGKTVLRGGFGIIYDRTNIVSNVLSSLLGVGFSDVFESSPLCNASGTPGGGCPGTPVGGVNPAANSFRVGQDGAIPLPTVTGLTSPILPTSFNLFANPSGGEPVAVGVDPNYRIGRSYSIDFTIQRELPVNFLLETGYIGRLGRDLPAGLDLAAAPYFVKDTTSGQTFAQAFDNVGCVLRGSAGKQITPQFTCPATVQDQPFFENQLPGLGALVGAPSSTQGLAALAGGQLADADAFTTFLIMDSYRDLIGMPSYNSLQIYGADLLEVGEGTSNYNAWFVTLHKRASHGLQFAVNYTLSKSLDEQGQVENNAARFSTPFDEKLQYGPSIFDHRSVLNASYDYELPFGSAQRFSFHNGIANRFISGWYAAGIFTASSGVPVYPTQGGNYGSDLTAGESGAVALIRTGNVSTGRHTGVVGSGGFGTAGNPAPPTFGSGINIFADPQTAAGDFRVPLFSVDGRTGEGNPVYGFGNWNFDIEVGKETAIAEGIKLGFSADAFNLFNNVPFANPSLDLTNAASFGVVTATNTPTNRNSSARYLQLGLRVSF